MINEWGRVEEMRPFELLKLIRDGVIKLPEVINYFVDSAVDIDPLDVIDALRELGWIEVSKDEEDIKPTERMLRALRGLHFSLTRLAPYGANSIVANPLFGRPKVPPMPSDLFVIMPFAEELRAVYEDHIRAVAGRLGITSTRGDDFFAASSIISDVWNAITRAKVLVADCTGRNPNVFYELGIAHTLGKPVIVIAQDKDDIPFDIQHIRIILYNFTPRGMLDFEHALEATIKRELETPRSLADVLSRRRHYKATATGSQKPNVTSTASDPLETLPPITVELKDEILNALKMTDKLDALLQTWLYQRRVYCSRNAP